MRESRNGTEAVIFCFSVKEWIRFCENEEVSGHSLYKLHENFHIFSMHFTEGDYTSLKNRLKSGAKPTIKVQEKLFFWCLTLLMCCSNEIGNESVITIAAGESSYQNNKP